MKTPQVLILTGNAFRRRLMQDVVECNEMRVVATDQDRWVDRVVSGEYRPNVVVVDLDIAGDDDGVRSIERLQALPMSFRPRIVAVASRGKEPKGSNGRALRLAGVVETPLDVGDFVRIVAKEAQEAVLAATV